MLDKSETCARIDFNGKWKLETISNKDAVIPSFPSVKSRGENMDPERSQRKT